MKRIHLLEFEDFPWFPAWIREGMTLYIATLHRLLKTHELIAPLVLRALEHVPTRRVIDLCSGAGGPMPQVLRQVRTRPGCEDVPLVLTDLFPNAASARQFNGGDESWLRYETNPVDATQVASDLTGLRTLICSLHHMTPSLAKGILKDAAQRRSPFLAFEISDNSLPLWTWWLAIPMGFLLSLVLTTQVRPLSLRQILFTYVIPIYPLAIAWDGAVSNARTYTPQDLDELLLDLRSDDYVWEVGVLPKPGMAMPMLYVLGLPKN